VEVLAYPRGTASLPLGGLRDAPARVALPRATARRVADRAGARTADVETARRLPLPLLLSGVTGRALDRAVRVLDRHGIRGVPFSGAASASDPAAAAESAGGGDSVAAAATYGDVTFAGIGTATAACGDDVMAFGHPLFFRGATALGLNEAPVTAIVPNPGGAYGGFKLAGVGASLGTVDQDRLAGIRGIGGAAPPSTAVTSRLAAPELGTSRDGSTTVVDTEFLSFATVLHLVANIDRVYDRIGDGTSDLAWTITGEREDGTPFSVAHDNAYRDDFDIAFGSAFELAFQVAVLQENRFEDVRLTGVDVDASVVADDTSLRITKVLSASSMQDRFRARRVLRVRRGGVVRLRVMLKRAGEDTAHAEDLRLRLPRRAGDGELRVAGGDGGGCFFCGGADLGAKSFEALLDKLANAPRNTDLGARYRPFRGNRRAEVNRGLDGVIFGSRRVFLDVRGR
jgi:hypothetical protein